MGYESNSEIAVVDRPLRNVPRHPLLRIATPVHEAPRLAQYDRSLEGKKEAGGRRTFWLGRNRFCASDFIPFPGPRLGATTLTGIAIAAT